MGVTASMIANSTAKTPQMAQSITPSQNTAVELVTCSSMTSRGMTPTAAMTTSGLMRRFSTRPRGVRMVSNPEPPSSGRGLNSRRDFVIGRSWGGAPRPPPWE